MIYLLVILMALSMAAAYLLNKKNIVAPGVIVSGMFLVSSTVAMLNLSAWKYEFKGSTVIVILLAVWVFIAGELIVNRCFKTALEKGRFDGPQTDASIVVIPRPTLIIFSSLLLLLFAYYFYDIYRLSIRFGNPYGLSGMISYARDAIVARMDISTLGNLCSCFAKCTSYVFLFIFIKDLVNDRIRLKYLWYLVPVFLYFPYIFIYGARSEYIYIIAFAVVVWAFMFQNRFGWTVKNSRRIILVGLSAIVLFLLIFRLTGFAKNSGSGTSAWRSISKYTGFSIPGFNSFLGNSFGENEYFGMGTLEGIYSVTNKLGLTNIELVTPFLEFTQLPGGIDSNIYTALARYVQGYSILGMAIIMALIAAVYGFCDNYIYYKKNSGLFLLLYASFFYPLVMISIEEVFFRNIFSTTTIYQTLFIVFVYLMLTKGPKNTIASISLGFKKLRHRSK